MLHMQGTINKYGIGIEDSMQANLVYIYLEAGIGVQADVIDHGWS